MFIEPFMFAVALALGFGLSGAVLCIIYAVLEIAYNKLKGVKNG